MPALCVENSWPTLVDSRMVIAIVCTFMCVCAGRSGIDLQRCDFGKHCSEHARTLGGCLLLTVTLYFPQLMVLDACTLSVVPQCGRQTFPDASYTALPKPAPLRGAVG